MWVYVLAGRYAGEIHDFDTEVGIRTVRSGMGIRVEGPWDWPVARTDPARVAPPEPTAITAPPRKGKEAPASRRIGARKHGDARTDS
jgi:hypothetical protein